MGNALLTWLTGGSALAALASVLLTVCALILGLMYRRYLRILGADRRRPAERQAYDARYGRASPRVIWRPAFTPGSLDASSTALTDSSAMPAWQTARFSPTRFG